MRFYLVVFSFLIGFHSLYGQDIHFSQMRFSPLNLNPALAGAENDFQAIVNYRNQWNSVAFPYQTIGASADWRFKQKARSNGFLAGGLNLFNDQAGDVKMTTSNINLSLAYHLYIDKNSTIGLALQGGIGQRGVNPSAGIWQSQSTGSGFNMNLNSGENFGDVNFTHLDAGAGLVYHYKKSSGFRAASDQFNLSAGIAAFHVNQPASPFLANGENDLAIRYSAFVYFDQSIPNTNFSVAPALYFLRQGPHQEVLLGSYIRVALIEGSRTTGFIKTLTTSFGGFYRFGDAFITKFMLEFADYSMGVSYDFNLSSLTPVSRGRGGAEIFLRYTFSKGFGRTSQSRIN
jgi:type IX secretion system PorP/SprF family membrane protein